MPLPLALSWLAIPSLAVAGWLLSLCLSRVVGWRMCSLSLSHRIFSSLSPLSSVGWVASSLCPPLYLLYLLGGFFPLLSWPGGFLSFSLSLSPSRVLAGWRLLSLSLSGSPFRFSLSLSLFCWLVGFFPSPALSRSLTLSLPLSRIGWPAPPSKQMGAGLEQNGGPMFQSKGTGSFDGARRARLVRERVRAGHGAMKRPL